MLLLRPWPKKSPEASNTSVCYNKAKYSLIEMSGLAECTNLIKQNKPCTVPQRIESFLFSWILIPNYQKCCHFFIIPVLPDPSKPIWQNCLKTQYITSFQLHPAWMHFLQCNTEKKLVRKNTLTNLTSCQPLAALKRLDLSSSSINPQPLGNGKLSFSISKWLFRTSFQIVTWKTALKRINNSWIKRYPARKSLGWYHVQTRLLF